MPPFDPVDTERNAKLHTVRIGTRLVGPILALVLAVVLASFLAVQALS